MPWMYILLCIICVHYFKYGQTCKQFIGPNNGDLWTLFACNVKEGFDKSHCDVQHVGGLFFMTRIMMTGAEDNSSYMAYIRTRYSGKYVGDWSLTASKQVRISIEIWETPHDVLCRFHDTENADDTT